MVAGWGGRGALSAAAALKRPVEAPEKVRLLGRVEAVKGYFNLLSSMLNRLVMTRRGISVSVIVTPRSADPMVAPPGPTS